jgi:hypothetical protein
MANLNSESCHSLIGLLTPEYLRFLKLQVVPWFTGTGTCISPVPVNRGILTGSLLLLKRRSSHGLIKVRYICSCACTVKK